MKVISTGSFIYTSGRVEYSFISAGRRVDFDFVSTDRRVELLADKDESNSYWGE